MGIGFRGQERRAEARIERSLAAQADGSAASFEGLSREDRRTIALLASLAALAGYAWILVCAFREHLGWGVAVLLGNALGAVLFSVIHPRQSLLPLFLMLGGVGISWFARFAALS